MPTANPRITITLTPQIHAILQKLSKLTGNSQSAMVAELLESSMPVFERMATLLEAAARLKAEGLQATDEIRESLANAESRLVEQLDLVLDTMEGGGRPILEQAEKLNRRSGRAQAKGGRSAAAAAALTPVPVTRGSGTPNSPGRGAGRQVKPQGKSQTGRGVSRG